MIGVGQKISLEQHGSAQNIIPPIQLDLYTEGREPRWGAREVYWDKRPPDTDYDILADPERNCFCIVGNSRA